MNHRFISVLFTFFVLIHDLAGDRVSTYDGMTQETVSNLVRETGFPFEFIDAPTYAAFIATHQPVSPTPAQILINIHNQASSKVVSGLDVVSTLQRAVELVTRDEINILRQRDLDRASDVEEATSLTDLKTRWAARAPLEQRSVSQIKTAIQNKINSGDAD